jgi:hypothetical protein
MSGIDRIQGVKKTLGIKSKLVQRSAYRQQYVGVDTGDHDEHKIESVTKVPPVQKYIDNAGILAKKLDRILNYKEEYRRYYQLEQGFEEHFEEPTENMDFVDHLYVVLSDMNEVILALRTFDKAFSTSYSQLVGNIIKNDEEMLSKATILIHVDYTLGFFKGRMKKAYDLHPEYFDFFIETETGLIPELLFTFRSIKAIIPEKIEELSIKQDRTGAIIDHKL